MTSILQQGLEYFPEESKDNLEYEVILGSFAYGVDTNTSDHDVVGVFTPAIGDILPHLNGYIPLFDDAPKPFTSDSRHGVYLEEQEYDVTVISLLKFLRNGVKGNPEVLDALYVPNECVNYASTVGLYMRHNRHWFLSKQAAGPHLGYAKFAYKKAFAALNDNNERNARVQNFGYDTKSAYHCVRVLRHLKQLLTTSCIDFSLDVHTLRAVRNGEWSKELFEQWYAKTVPYIKELVEQSFLRTYPYNNKIRSLIYYALEERYGSVADTYKSTSDHSAMLVSKLEQCLQEFK